LNICGNYGDPIYHPKFHDILSICNDSDSSYLIHTNGSGKSLDWWKETFDLMRKDSKIFFSIDGMEDTCGGYRVNFSNKDFFDVLEVLKLAKRYEFESHWVYTPFNFNEHQIVQAAKLALDNGISFMVRKSSRWDSTDDILRPLNPKLSIYVDYK
jgi:regulation of enolase protein 1 (concanavalin A-like superfamily)